LRGATTTGFSLARGFGAAFAAAFGTGLAALAETVFLALIGLADGFFTDIYELPLLLEDAGLYR
jgi:hypothetical protein